MRKILLAFEGSHFSSGAFEFARQMNETDKVLLTGVFLPHIVYAGYGSYGGGMVAPVPVPVMEGDDTEGIRETVEQFENLCVKNNIEFRVHQDTEEAVLAELIKESRFADLLIIGSEVFYKDIGTDPNSYIKNILHDAECPVLIVPEKYDYPDTVILAYDGSESSVFAMRMFAYIFPVLSRKPALLVYASENGKIEFPDQEYMEEFAARHFPDLTLFKLQTDPKKYFAGWVAEKKHALLVTGSFGRSGFSRLLKKSFVTDVIKENELPVFVTHR